MLKRIVSGLLLLACATAYAAGPLDGIYQWNNGNIFYTVIQTGDGVIIGRYRSESGSLVKPAPATGVPATAKQFDIWSLFSGTLGASQPTTVNGLPATVRSGSVTGETAFGACQATLIVSFTTVTATGAITAQVTANSSVPTAYGQSVFLGTMPDAAGNCAVSLNNGTLGSFTVPVGAESLVKIR